MRRLIASLLVMLLAGFVRPGFGETNPLVVEGQHIYLTTTRTDGTPIKATVQNDVPLPPGASACANCHRRSGYGVSEGGSRSLNLTAPALFEATEKSPFRPAYTEATLVRAIDSGIASDGRVLDPTMPRYELNADDADALTHYLRTLGAAPPDGVTESELSIATIISADAPAHEKEAVLRVMERYVEMKNAESRRESERAAASARHYYGRIRHRAHRTWRLHVWTLNGLASTWADQLETHYSEDRPFAVVSGTAGTEWMPIHQFCERRELPCLLTLSPSPTGDDKDFYSLYFSSGPLLEARITAAHIGNLQLSPEAKVLVVHRADAASRAAVDILNDELAIKGIHVTAVEASSKREISARRWHLFLHGKQVDVLVAWVPTDSIVTLAKVATDQLPALREVYTAESFSDWLDYGAAPELLVNNVNHIYPYSLPSAGATQFPREDLWLKKNGMSDLDPISAGKVLYACKAFGLGLSDIQNNFSREYLLESLEHALDGTQLTSLFPRTSLGPDQRMLSRGAFVGDLSRIHEGQLANAVWVQP